jgi:predicted metal-dependent phosphoesterase TrpH
MPRRAPFTALCQAAARPAAAGRIDLHVHTIHSDGAYTPVEVVELARRSGLASIAITDHDTLDGVPPARQAAAGKGVQIVPGVEISTDHHGHELHLLAYYVGLDDPGLTAALQRLCTQRVNRFREMVERLRGCGVSLDERKVSARAATGAVGRRHLAQLMVDAGRASTVREAFFRYLGDRGRVAVPKARLPVQEAIALVRGAGGVASWAHPNYDGIQETLAELRAWGLGALEVEFPSCRPARTRALRALAASCGLAVTGGSDCHGPGHFRQEVGARGITAAELAALRRLSLC